MNKTIKGGLREWMEADGYELVYCQKTGLGVGWRKMPVFARIWKKIMAWFYGDAGFRREGTLGHES